MVHGWRDVTTICWTRKQETLKLADKHIHVMRCQAQWAGDKPTASVAIKHGRVRQVAQVETRLGTNLVEQLVWSWSLVHLVDTGEDMVTLAWGGPAHWGWRSSVIFFLVTQQSLTRSSRTRSYCLVARHNLGILVFVCLHHHGNSKFNLQSFEQSKKILQKLFKHHSTFWHSVNILCCTFGTSFIQYRFFVFALIW